MKSYIPRPGDIIWIDFNPSAGKEITKRRPMLVLSDADYNKKTGKVIGCPITSKIKGYPFEVILPSSGECKGAVLSDQVKNFDWCIRNAEFFEKTTLEICALCVERINGLIEIQK